MNTRTYRRIMSSTKKPTRAELSKGLMLRIAEAIETLPQDVRTGSREAFVKAATAAFEQEMASRRMSFLERNAWTKEFGANFLSDAIARIDKER
jgi:hypothetical protein